MKLVVLLFAILSGVLLSSLSFGLNSMDQSPQNAFMQQFKSEHFILENESNHSSFASSGRYPYFAKFLLENVIGWSPSGEGKIISSSCSPEHWMRRTGSFKSSHELVSESKKMNQYFQQCKEESETGVNGSLQNYLKFLSLNYQISDNSFFRQVLINLPGGVQLKGLLGLKGDLKVRPLVVLRLGVFGSIDDFRAERAWLMMLFDQSPFNILVLENISNSNFAERNGQFVFGGYDEGIQNILIAKMLRHKNEPISKIIDSLHFVGVSLGGHGVLFSSLLNKTNSTQKRSLIDSTLAICPVINLKETMQELSRGGIKKAFVDSWSRKRLKSTKSTVAEEKKVSSGGYLEQVISGVAQNYKGAMSYSKSQLELPFGMSDGSDFWKLNDYWRFYQKVSEPVVVLTTEQDPVVPYEMNSKLLVENKMNIQGSNFQVLKFTKGFHCTLPISYDWKFISSLLQMHILENSKDFILSEKRIDIDLEGRAIGEILKDVYVRKISVKEFSEFGKSVSILIEIGSKSATSRVEKRVVSLSLSDIDFKLHNTQMSEAEKQMIIRWLHQNLSAEIEKNENKATIVVSWPVVH